MRAPSWWRRRRTPAQVGTVTIELVADTSRFEAAVRDVASAVRYNRAVAHQRSLGQAQVGVLLDDLARSVGLDPVQAWRLPGQRDRRLAALSHPDRVTRQAAEAAWLAEHRAHQAQQVMAQRTVSE